MITIWIVLCLLVASTVAVKVCTSLGDIEGVKLKTRLDEEFYAFRGMRYAKSPEGELRFKEPQPVEAWKPKVLDATKDGPKCPQVPFNSTDNSEDCLRLNVYSKNLRTLKPVIVFIHSGAFYFYSAQSETYAGPQFFMDRDIVLVTINYRLGTLGFLSTGTLDAPGNAGLKDQALAIKWVGDHIQNFGGDPNSITLLGYSAGSMSVGLHMCSPMTKGLFHRAIAMSSSPFTDGMIFAEDQLDLAKKQAELVNCPVDSISSMVNCLKKVPFEEFLKTQASLFANGLFSFPVVEKDFHQQRFITEQPLDSFQSGRFYKVPLITGFTKDELVQSAYNILQNANSTKRFNDDWYNVAAIYFHYEKGTQKSREISDALRERYLKNNPLKLSGPFEPLGMLFSDALIGFPTHRFVHLVAKYIPVHYYLFSYKGRFGDFIYPGNTSYGAVHQDDLQYLLRNWYISPIFKKSDPEDTTVERLTRLWANFAKTGDPNNSKDEFLRNLNWEPLSLEKENYLEIGDELVVKNGLYLDRFDFWEKLMPLN